MSTHYTLQPIFYQIKIQDNSLTDFVRNPGFLILVILSDQDYMFGICLLTRNRGPSMPIFMLHVQANCYRNLEMVPVAYCLYEIVLIKNEISLIYLI